jgi:Glutaredoxin-like domain (DUF836)
VQAVLRSPAGRFHAGRWLLATGLTVAAVAGAGLNVVGGTQATHAPGGPSIIGCAAGLGLALELVLELIFLALVAIVGGGITILGAILYWRGSAGGPPVMILANLLAILGFGYRSVYPTQQVWAAVVVVLALVPVIAILVLLPPLRSLPVAGRGWLVGVLVAVAAPCLVVAAWGLGQDLASALQSPPVVGQVRLRRRHRGHAASIGRVAVVLVTRKGCHLCDEALDLLRAAGVEPELADVDADDELFRLYDWRVPVILADGVEVAEGRITAESLTGLTAGRSSPQ